MVLWWLQSKHSSKLVPQSLQVNDQPIVGTSIYPATHTYFPFPVKGSRQATLFAYADGTLMLRREFDAILKRLLEFCALSSKVLRVLVSEWEQPRQQPLR